MSVFKSAKVAITFEGGSYETNIAGQVVSFPSIKLYAALITVTQAKKIVETEIQGRNGTVKEYIGLADYDVTIDGTITAANGDTPDIDVIDLKKMLNAPVPVDVVCPWLQNLDITNILVMSYELPQDAGGAAYQTFTIHCKSDTPIELRVSNV